MPNEDIDPQNTYSSTSPLNEVDPTSLDELFRRIDEKLVANLPREIHETDIENIVEYYLKERKRFLFEQANNIRPTREKSPNSGKTKKQIIEDSLKDLQY